MHATVPAGTGAGAMPREKLVDASRLSKNVSETELTDESNARST
jgi:hypothetical protein